MKKAIVVGSGAAGGAVARVLARSGAYEVWVLEKGGNFFRNLGGDNSAVTNLFSNDEVGWESRTAPINQDPLLEPRSFRADTGAGDRSFVGDVNDLPTTVGGATVHYDAKARRYREVDFITNSLMGGTADKPAIPGTTYADWPMTYDQLEPFYAVTEEVIGVQGPARRSGGKVVNPNPYESYRSTPFPMPPGVDQLNSLLPAEAARRLGYSPAPVPTSVLSRPYRGRPACNDCGYCLNYGCTTGAKSSGIWPLNDALASGRAHLISGANVVEILYDPPARPGGRYVAQGVRYLDPEGGSHTIKGDLVVLANTPVEASRLSFLSGIGRARPDESNIGSAQPTATEPSGLLGRNLMFHLQTAVVTIVNQPIHSFRGRTSTQTLDAFAGSGPTPAQFDPTVPRAGLLEIGGNLNPVGQAEYFASFLSGQAHKELMALGPFVDHLTTFTMQGEDMPQITNYVDLDPAIVDVWGQPVPRITYKSHPYEIAASAYYQPKMVEIMENIGGPGSAYPSVRPLMVLPISPAQPSVLPGQAGAAIQENLLGATPINDIPASAHIMGTHRMALDPGHGPCDPYGRYWAFDNLYYTGGGLQPTAPGFNVTLTFWALSYWMACAIVSGVGGRDSYTAADVRSGVDRLLRVLQAIDPDTMIARAL
ncbi:MAG TPA: GMC family oxidoreductase [Acidimicrobiales bacterium]|nr:GMC family oxidoreductase [Acidimicrobiales bacterium]